MILTPQEFSKAFDEIKQTSLTHSTCKMIIFVSSLNVDAICASKILSSLLKKNLIVFQLLPVVGYNDLKAKYQKIDDSISTIILIGCGSMVDLESFLEIDINDHVDTDPYNAPVTPDSSSNDQQQQQALRLTRKIYVIDGHRPWNLDNLFGSHMVTCFDDGSSAVELKGEEQAYSALVAIDSDAEDEDDDDDEEEEEQEELADTDADEDFEESIKTSRKRRLSSPNPGKKQRKSIIKQHEKTIEEYYNQGTSLTISAALQICYPC
ncbi:unnamed protein product [Ambrosiozyma monospora]|uniref:Unnamed protein product n=1 Tax=Ambrosiozyma monospora TaxID=43982 RepID=A0A9W6YZQ2_AMBMO|nr:unnamed protein product [Ambrosiozyma monospora]